MRDNMVTKNVANHISEKLNGNNNFARAEAAHCKLSEEEASKLLSDPAKNVRLVVVKVQALTHDQVSAVLKGETEPEVKKTLVRYQKLDEQQIGMAIRDSSAEVAIATITVHQLTKLQAEETLSRKEPEIRVATLTHQKNLPVEIIGMGLVDDSPSVRIATVEHQKLTGSLTDNALSDENAHVRRQAVIYQKLNENQAKKARSDPDRYVREAAKEHHKISLFKRMFR